jgi:glyoxylase-like metal-dependent hydrolase (beta-lactamase superfamily II)
VVANPFSKFGQFHDADPFEANFFWTGGPVEVAEGTWFTSLGSGVTAFDTTDGLVLVDTGAVALAPAMAGMIRAKTDAPLHTAIVTHGHIDHAFGVEAFLAPGQPPPHVVAHRLAADRFARYERTKPLNDAVNLRQFGGSVPEGHMMAGIVFGTPTIPPDTWYEGDGSTLEVGGLAFELHHARGETDDATWVWCPQRRVLCPGDLFIWSVPNAGNPQKVQRYPWDWAAALRDMAQLDVRSLCPGHGGPVVDDPDTIHRMLVTTAEYLEAIVNQTIDAMNDGGPPAVDVVRRVVLPDSELPWLRPVYDEGEFYARAGRPFA